MADQQEPEVAPFSALIRARREALGLSQREVAEELKVSQTFISQLEARTTPGYLPDRALFHALVTLLRIDPAEALRVAGYLPAGGDQQPKSPDELIGALLQVISSAD